jgi:signal transduction histidine kinase
MPRREILVDLSLDDTQHAAIELYEATRIVEAIAAEIDRATIPDSARSSLVELGESLRTSRVTGEAVTQLMDVRNSIRGQLERLSPAAFAEQKSPEAIMRLFDMLDVRVRELSARTRKSDGWIESTEFEFRHSFELYFEVMSACAGARYDVVFDERPAGDAYRIVLSIETLRDETMRVPVRLRDITWDLAENARKYSPPGSLVTVSLVETDRTVSLTVRDRGIGIPEREIERVVEYGVRGSNGAETTGGHGIGLTKAYSLVRGWNGRMWIDSSDAGTTVELEIPKP